MIQNNPQTLNRKRNTDCQFFLQFVKNRHAERDLSLFCLLKQPENQIYVNHMKESGHSQEGSSNEDNTVAVF